MKNKTAIKIGDRIRVTDYQSSLPKEVVYTVQGTRNGFPVVYDFWMPVLVKHYVKVP